MKTHICPACQIRFEGRENKKYCTAKCKTAHNNMVFLKKNSNANKILKEIKKNTRIVSKVYELFNSEPIPRHLITATGLNTRFITENSNSGSLIFGEFELRKNLTNNTYSIFKIYK